MTSFRRHHDTPGAPSRRREDQLERLVAELRELNRRGSRNFRRYRVRAYVLFATLTAVSTFAVWLADHNGREAQRNLAEAVRRTTLTSCENGNEVRVGLRAVVREALPPGTSYRPVLRFALDAFADRDCDQLVRRIPRRP